MTIYVLRAFHMGHGNRHEFMEMFSSLANVDAYLISHPGVTCLEITSFELDPK